VTTVTTLSIGDVKQIIATAQLAAADPVSVAMQIFSGLGEQAMVTGANLRDAVAASAVPLVGPITGMLDAIQQVTKLGNLVTLNSSQDVQTVLNGTQVRLKQQVSFEVNQTGAPALNNIKGLSVHKIFWIDIHSVQLKQSGGQKVVSVDTSAGTREFPLG
jgi:hypothetical protein